jgi:putative endopeptidase
MKSRLFLGAAIAFALTTSAYAADSPGKPPAAIGAWGVDTRGLSKTVRPGDDFYRYVNEGWLKTAKMPPGLPALESFTEVYLSTEQRVLGIIKESREGNDAPGTPEQQIADYYRSFADMERRNALGITPIASTLSIIAGTKDRNDLARLMAMPWMDGPIGAGVTSDAADPRRQIGAVAAGGLTMPTRDYYLDPIAGQCRPSARPCRTMWPPPTGGPGIPDAEARAAKVMALETGDREGAVDHRAAARRRRA